MCCLGYIVTSKFDVPSGVDSNLKIISNVLSGIENNLKIISNVLSWVDSNL